MADSMVSIVSLLVLAFAVRGNAQCFLDCDCTGTAIPSTDINQCLDITTGISFLDSTGTTCTNFPVRFGWTLTTFTGDEQGQEHAVEVGFVEGRFPQQVDVNVEAIYQTAGEGDIRINTPHRTFSALTTEMQEVTFTLLPDAVAQESSETLTLRLNFDETLFDESIDTLITELHVTIIDCEMTRVRLSLSEYRADEGFDDAAPVRVNKDSGTRLANPVTLRITPLTADDALAQGVVTTFPQEDGLTPLNILRSPIRANDLDFITTAFNVTLPADEGAPSPTTVLSTPVPIVDDELNERGEQFFIVRLEVIDAVNSDAIDIDRDVATVVIGDNDDIHIGFSQELYKYFETIPLVETVITNLTLVKDDNRVSEQIFRVGINVNDPSITDVAAATLETDDTGQGEWDYRVSLIGQDFLLADIFPLQQSLVVPFVLTGDIVPEGLEGFQLTASVETAGGFPRFQLPLPTSTTAFQSTTITIIDNDVQVGWEQTSYTVNEVTGVFQEVCARLKKPTAAQDLVIDIRYHYVSIVGTADGTDFTQVTEPATINFPASMASTANPPAERRQCVNVMVTDDLISEETESFTLELDYRDGQVNPAATEIFILDDDEATFGFIDAPYEANEADGEVFVRVGLIGMSRSLERDVSVLLSFISNGSALNGSDYSAPVGGQILQFGPGSVALDIPLPLIADDLSEPNETLQASLGFPSESPVRVSIDSALATATITIFEHIMVTTDAPTPPSTTSPTTTSSHNQSGTSTKSPLSLTPTTSITDETTSGSTEEDGEPVSGFNNTITYAMAAVIVLLIAILVLLLIIYLVRRKTRKQTATRQSGEGGDIKLQSTTAAETSTGSQDHVYEPMDKRLLKKPEVDVATPNEAYGINRESANKLEVDVTNPNEAYGIANRLEFDVTSPNEAYGIANRGSAIEDYVETDIVAHTSKM